MDAVIFATIMALRISPPERLSPNSVPIREVTSSAASKDALKRWTPIIGEVARRFAIPETWIRAVMQAESGGQITFDGRPITSRAGAMGLMQIMPETYAELRPRFGLGPDPYNPHDNILAGAAYLRDMFNRYGYPALFAAYNAGPERFEAYIRDGENLPTETWNYLGKLGFGIAETLHAMGSTVPSLPNDSSALAAFPPVDFSSGRALFFVLDNGPTRGSSATRSVPGSTDITVPNGSLFVLRSDRGAPRDEKSPRFLLVPLAGEPQ